VEVVYDRLLVPALNYFRKDRAHDGLSEADQQAILLLIREIAIEIDGDRVAAESLDKLRHDPSRRARILGCPVRDAVDEMGLTLLQDVLDRDRWQVEIVSSDILAGELVQTVAEEEPHLICLGSLPPGGLTRVRYLCKRLRARYPHVKIVIGRWGLRSRRLANVEQLREVGADSVTTTLAETRIQLNAWFPVVTQNGTGRAAAPAMQSLS
jgi:hypothetical protein